MTVNHDHPGTRDTTEASHVVVRERLTALEAISYASW